MEAQLEFHLIRPGFEIQLQRDFADCRAGTRFRMIAPMIRKSASAASCRLQPLKLDNATGRFGHFPRMRCSKLGLPPSAKVMAGSSCPVQRVLRPAIPGKGFDLLPQPQPGKIRSFLYQIA